MNKYIRYVVFAVIAVFWLGTMIGYLYCLDSLPENFSPDDLHLACFGVGLFGLPFLAGLIYASFHLGDVLYWIFHKTKQ